MKGLGYRILERNYCRQWGEIDIVAKFKKDIVFVEVKSQEKGAQFFPAQNVNYFKQKRLIRAAKTWLAENKIPAETNWQIDVAVVEIDEENGLHKVEHLRNAVWAK